jgi:hypothetical protein
VARNEQRVHLIAFPPSLGDCSLLRQQIINTEAAVVVLDPLSAGTGRLDWHKDSDMRSVLTPLAQIADDTGAAIVAIRHLVKGAREREIDKGSGSVAIGAAARSVLRVEQDRRKESPVEYVLFVLKSNLASPATPFAYELVDGAINLLGDRDVMLEDLVDVASEGPQTRDKAKRVIAALLRDGPRRSALVESVVLAAGVSLRTYQRARNKCG